MVWDATVDIMKGLFNDIWINQDVIVVDHCVDITLPVRIYHRFLYIFWQISKIALFVIGAAGETRVYLLLAKWKPHSLRLWQKYLMERRCQDSSRAFNDLQRRSSCSHHRLFHQTYRTRVGDGSYTKTADLSNGLWWATGTSLALALSILLVVFIDLP